MATPNPVEQSPPADRLLEALASCRKISAQHDLGVLFGLIAAEAAKLLGADRASIFLLDREKSELWSLAAVGEKRIRLDARLGLAGAAALSGQTINVDDARRDPRFYPGVDARTGYRTRNVLAMPLRNQEGEIIGAVQALNKKGGGFTAADEVLLQTLASQAGNALETAQFVRQLREQRDQLQEDTSHLRKEMEGQAATQQIIGMSDTIQLVVRRIQQICDIDVNVLITGESGTGKEMVARAIHLNSGRARQPMVSLNCAALPDSLVESELFGIEKGVATGVEARIGKFEAATGGTLLLDEIGDLNLVAQAKILRVLQEKTVERVGGKKPISIDTRVLAATNKDLEAEIKQRAFREDLYYRLNVIHIHLPALREIPEDIPLLANYFLARFCHEISKEPMKLSPGATRCLRSHPWPGNIRELQNEIRRTVIATRRATITEDDMSEAVRTSAAADGIIRAGSGRSLKEIVAQLETRLIREALNASHHNQQQAARALGLSRQGLIKKMKRYGLT